MATWLRWLSGARQTKKPDDLRRVITMLGACRVTIQEGRFHCFCKAGVCVHLSTSIDLSEPCSTCGHLLREHEDVPDDSLDPTDKFPTLEPNPPDSFSGTHARLADTGLPSIISLRTRSIETLARLIEQQGVIHVRGTPASGKSTMAKLLSRYYSRHELALVQHVVFIADWKDWMANDMDTVGFLIQQCNKLEHKIKRMEFLNEENDNVIFILDEAQVTYHDAFFWYSVIKERLAAIKGPRFCLFTSYGSPSTGSPDYPETTTPPVLNREQRISLTIPNNLVGHDLCLFYKKEEFRDVVKKWTDEANLKIGEDVANYVFEQTNGHPGVAGAMFRYIKKFHRENLMRSCISQIAYHHVGTALENSQELFNFINVDVAGRSLPSKARLGGFDSLVVHVLLRILTHGSLEFDKSNHAMDKCFRLGFIHVEEPEDGRTICVLPSFLHARYVDYTYGQSSSKPFPFTKYPNIEALAFKVLQRFSKKMLSMAERGQQYGPSGNPRPLEATYQDEFYRCFGDEVGPDISIVSERSCVGRGRIDFQILAPGWGFEILRDGDRISEHCERFKPGGTYHQSIQQCVLSDWLILDCRRTSPRKTYPEPKLWRVIFSQDWSYAQILNGNNEEIYPEYVLTNY